MKSSGSPATRVDRTCLAIVGIAILVGSALRASGVGSTFIFADEAHTLQLVSRGYAEILSTYDRVGSGLALPLMQRLLVDLGGESRFLWRLPALLPSIGSLALVFPVARRAFGVRAAAIATLWVALNPILIHYGHFARSYSLMVFGVLWLALCIGRAAEDEEQRWRPWVGAALCFGLLPWFHFVSLGAVATAGAVSAVLAFSRPRLLKPLTIAAAAGGLLCIALYLPAWESFLDFFDRKAGKGVHPVALLDVAELLAGSRVVAVGALLALPLSAIIALRQLGRSAWLPVSLAVVPPAILALASPVGGPYAYARYALASNPFVIMLLAWCIVVGLEQVFSGALAISSVRRRPATLLAASFVVVAVFALSPLAPWHPRDGPFGNTFSGIRRLPLFNEPFAEMPAYYASPEVTRIIEAPAVVVRGMMLYRNYYMQHRRPTVLVPSLEPGELCALAMGEGPEAESTLIYHQRLRSEADAYWDVVFPGGTVAALPTHEQAFMRSFRKLKTKRDMPPARATIRRLTEAWGEPVYRDHFITAWELGRSVCNNER